MRNLFTKNNSPKLNGIFSKGIVILFKFAFLFLLMGMTSYSNAQVILTEDFASASAGDNTSNTGSSSAWAGNANFPTVVSAYQAGGAARIGVNGAPGSITSKPLDLSLNGGNFTVKFDVKGWSTVEGDIRITILDGTTNVAVLPAQTVTYTAVMGSSSFETKTITFTGGTANQKVRIETTAKRAFIDNVIIESIVTAPTLTVTPTALTGFTYQAGYGPSTYQSYQLSGSNLTGFPGNITVTAPANYQVSTDNVNFSTSVTYGYTSATLLATTVYARLSAGLPVASYSGNISNAGGGATTQNVAVSGSVVQPIFASVANGDWNTPATWDKNAVPGPGDEVVVRHAVTLTSAVTRNNGSVTTVQSGGTLLLGAAYTNNGSTVVQGAVQVNGGGSATGNSFSYAATGTTLILNNNAGLLAVNNNIYWPTANGPQNVTVQGTGAQLATAAGAKTVTGNLTIAAPFELQTATLTVNGSLLMNAGGSVTTSSPIYGNAANLVYRSAGAMNRGLEWNAAMATQGTPGLPHNVQVTNNTNLSLNNTAGPSKAIFGNLTIDAGSTLNMGNANTTLEVKGNTSVTGALTLSTVAGGNFSTEGNLTFNAGYTFTSNNRICLFTKDGIQTISAATALVLPYVTIGKTGGTGTTLQLLSDLTIGLITVTADVLVYTNASDIMDLNGRRLTIGITTGVNRIGGPGSIKGSATSSMTIAGTANGSVGSILFTPGSQILGNLTINRGTALAMQLGSDLTIQTSLTLTSGILEVGSNNLIFGLTATHSGAGANSFVRADAASTPGNVVKLFNASNNAFTYPIGGGSNYTPATITFGTATYSANAQVAMNLRNAKHPNAASANNFIQRYWVLNPSNISSYTANLQFSYAPLTVTGTEINMQTGGYDASVSAWTLGNMADVTNKLLVINGETNINKSYTGANNYSPIASRQTDYFRTKQSGDFSNLAVWQSSPDGITWQNSTLIPNNLATKITIAATHTVDMSAAFTMSNIEVNGILNNTGHRLTLTFPGMEIKNGGKYISSATLDYSQEVTYSGGGKITIRKGGRIVIGTGGGISGQNLDTYANNSGTNPNVWEDGAIFEWNNTGTFGTANITYFQNAAVGVRPVFLVTKNGGTPGAGSATTINGIFELNSNVNFTGGGQKNFRDGIRGNATLTQTGGSFYITGVDAILDGADLNIILASQMNIQKSSSVPLGGKVTVSGANINNNYTGNILTINGSLDITTIQFSNLNGTITVNGTLRTAYTGIAGLYGTNGAIPSGIINLNDNSTIEYYANADQRITSSTVIGGPYYNLILSGTGTKTPISAIDINTLGSLKITGPIIVDASSNNIGNTGANSTKFEMDGGRLILGTNPSSALPLMDGAYNITGGVIQYNGTSQTIRSKTYQNIEVTGSGVANSSGNITLNPTGSFTVKNAGVFSINSNSIRGAGAKVIVESGGLFKTGNNKGFHGFTSTFTDFSSIHSELTDITLMPGSTVEYTRAKPPLSTDEQPITNANGLQYQNLILSGTGNKIAPSNDLIILGNLTKSTGSVFVHNNGTVIFNGTAAQDYRSVAPQMVMNNLTNNNKVGLNVKDNLSVYRELKLGATSKFNIENNVVVSLKSDANNTANVAPIPNDAVINYTTSGAFIVERYIPQHRKSWHVLASPTKGSTIKSAWQEGNTVANGNNNPGYGINITSELTNALALGFDGVSTAPSVKYYIPGGSPSTNYKGIANTSELVNAQLGYFVFVRGDRSVVNTSQAPTATTLRTKGKLFAPGAEAYPVVNIPAGMWQLVGNPYASAIKFDLLTRTNLTNFYYVWDVKLDGNFNTGQWRTIASDGTTVPSGTYPALIQSGQGFFVQSSGAAATLSFAENAKVTGSTNAAFLISESNSLLARAQSTRLSLRANIYAGHSLQDGLITQFSSEYADGVDANDAEKILNRSENMGVSKNGKIFSIDRRALPHYGDTIYYYVDNLTATNYHLEFEADGLDESEMYPFLIDQYTKKETRLPQGISTLSFVVDNNEDSKAYDRFYVVFKTKDALPVQFAGVSAYTKEADIVVEWKTQNESNMLQYEVETSADGKTFLSAATVAARNINAATYSWIDKNVSAGYHFYRIKIVGKDGKISYSTIVKVLAGNNGGRSSISVYPNPIQNQTIRIQMEQQAAGKYKAKVYNVAGQVIATKDFDFAGGNGSESLSLPAKAAAGVYHLEISRNGQKIWEEKILK